MTGHTENNLAIINESEESSGNISSSSSDAEINGIDRRIIYQQRPVSKIQLTRHSCVNGSQSRSRRSSLSNETSQPLQDASLHGFLLGSTLGAGLASAYFASRPHLGLFFAAAALFHYLDGLVIALVFSGDSKPSTFFILGSRTAPPIGYMRHHVFALVEFVILDYVFPSWKAFGLLNYIGFVLVVAGQVIKTSAMLACRSGFSGSLKKQPESLVENGVYSVIRHPYLFGIYWWMVGMQLLLTNPACLCYTIYSLQGLFQEIIEAEECVLEKGFGDVWLRYRRTTPTWLPLIP